jgi:hypothetical protein
MVNFREIRMLTLVDLDEVFRVSHLHLYGNVSKKIYCRNSGYEVLWNDKK